MDAGEFWHESDWVFTREDGHPLSPTNIYKALKRVAAKIGLPEACVHDLRHSYSVASVRAGDDVKTIQANLGHSTAAFTLEVYTHVTGQMKRDSAARMDAYIRNITGNK